LTKKLTFLLPLTVP